MTDDFTSETLAYLLDELDAGRRAQFEQRLARDAAAEAAFKACADSFAEFVLTQAPGQPMDDDARERIMAAVIQAAGAGSGTRRTRWTSYLWPMAAAALLALNVCQWVLGHREPAAMRVGTTAGEETAVGGASTPVTTRVAANGANGSRGVSNVLPQGTRPEVMEVLERLSVLRRENDRLQASNAALNTQTQRLSQQLAVLTAANSGTTRLVAIELVDAASYANGNRNGLLDLAKTILTTPGVVAASPALPANDTSSNSGSTLTLNQSTERQPSFAGSSTTFGTVASAGSITIVDTSTLSGLTVSGTSGNSTIMGVTATAAITTNAGVTSPTATDLFSTGITSTGTPPTTEPYAWSVFDASQSQGYLNLYNLPTVPSGQSLQLWVQPVGSNTFENVGTIPSQYYGGSGSVYFKLGSQSAVPSQILITVEPSQAVPTTPTGNVVVRGP